MKNIKTIDFFVRKPYIIGIGDIMPRGDYRPKPEELTGRTPLFPGEKMKTVSIYIPKRLIPKLKKIGNKRIAELIEKQPE